MIKKQLIATTILGLSLSAHSANAGFEWIPPAENPQIQFEVEAAPVTPVDQMAEPDITWHEDEKDMGDHDDMASDLPTSLSSDTHDGDHVHINHEGLYVNFRSSTCASQ